MRTTRTLMILLSTFVIFAVLTAAVPRAPVSAQAPTGAATVPLRGNVKNSIDQLRARVKELAEHTDTKDSVNLLHVATSELKRAECTALLADGGGFIMKDTEKAACIWNADGLVGLDLANITARTSGGSIYADLLSTTFGIIRASVGSMVTHATEGDVELEEALQRLTAGGGNLVLGFQAPVRIDIGGNNRWSSLFTLGLRTAFDFPALGSDIEGTHSSLAAGLDWQGRIRSDDSSLELFGQLKVETLYGSSSFLDALDLGHRCCAYYTRFAVGGVFRESITINYTRPFWGTDTLLDAGGQLSVTAKRMVH